MKRLIILCTQCNTELELIESEYSATKGTLFWAHKEPYAPLKCSEPILPDYHVDLLKEHVERLKKYIASQTKTEQNKQDNARE